MSRKRLFLLFFVIAIFLFSPFFLTYIAHNRGRQVNYELFPSITCDGDSYWYMVEYAFYPDGKLAFLLIQKAKHGNPIRGQSRRSGGPFVATRIEYILNDKIRLPNKQYTIYENLCTGNAAITATKITNKSTAQISRETIESFFNSKRSSYDLDELLKYSKNKGAGGGEAKPRTDSKPPP